MTSRELQEKHAIKQTPKKVLTTDENDFFETDMLESEINVLKNPENLDKWLDDSRQLPTMMAEDNSMMFPNDNSQLKVLSFHHNPFEFDVMDSS